MNCYFLNLIILLILCNSNSGQLNGYHLSIEEIDSLYNMINESSNSLNINSMTQKSDSIDQKSQCTSTQLIDKFLESITPDDYEEGQKMDIYGKVNSPQELVDRIERLNSLSSNISKTFEPILKRLQMRISENLMLIDLPQQCLNSLVRIVMAIRDGDAWAMKFMDSFPYPNGKSIPVADYDNCLMIESPQTKEDIPVIRGQYCSLGTPKMFPSSNEYENNEIDQSVINRINELNNKQNISMGMSNENMRLKGFKMTTQMFYDMVKANEFSDQWVKLPMAICIPTTCSAKHIEYAMNKVLYPITQMPIVINPDCDYLNKPIKLNNFQKTSISIFSVLIILVLISTLFDLWENYSKDKNNKNNTLNKPRLLTEIVSSLSAIKNFKKIFWSERTNKGFRMLDGVRAILAFTINLQHEHSSSALMVHSKNTAFSSSLLYSKKYMHVLNLNMVELFFFLGGMMTCYVMLSKLHKSKGKFNYFQFVLFRYLRVLPVTMGSILLIFIFPLIGNGPYWNMFSNFLYIPCHNNWLPALLMTSNFDITLPDKYICNVANWSTPVDLQLHLLGPIIFLALYFWPIFGVIWNLILIGIGVFICLAPRLIWNIPHFFEYPEMESIYTFVNLVIIYYMRFESHFVSYAFGMLCGYLIRQKPNLYLGGPIGETFLWITSWTLTFYTLDWNHYIFNPNYPLTKTGMLLFLGLSKLMYLSGWFWLFYACATGRAGFINKFFSWKGFKAFANLSYEIAVLHAMVILYRFGTARDPVLYSAYFVWTNSFYDFLLTFLISIVFYVLVSAPFTNLMNIYIKKQ